MEPDTADVFGPLVAGRECGGCIVCCEHAEVRSVEFTKPAGQLCVHARATGGCGIYPDRPPVCRRWHCLWRHVAELPDDARPNRLGVMFGYAWDDGDGAGYVHALAFAGEGALQRPDVAAAARTLARLSGLRVHGSDGSGPWRALTERHGMD